MKLRDVIARYTRSLDCEPLAAPAYQANGRDGRVCLALETYRRHMTNEGSLLQEGLAAVGYELWGRHLVNDCAEVPTILSWTEPGTVFVQDARDWHAAQPGAFDKSASFRNWQALATSGAFCVAPLKDAHGVPRFQRQMHQEMGIHAWAVYYHPELVAHIAPWVRKEHLIRTYHCLDKDQVPPYQNRLRYGCLLSGAENPWVYPLRQRLAEARLPGWDVLPHPGYGASGCATNDYLKTLQRYEVAVCTSSVYGYALRKIIEATACGCVVVTDLPEDDVLPKIDENLVRIDPKTPVERIAELVRLHSHHYSAARQSYFAQRACDYYDYRRLYAELAHKIDAMRRNYHA